MEDDHESLVDKDLEGGAKNNLVSTPFHLSILPTLSSQSLNIQGDSLKRRLKINDYKPCNTLLMKIKLGEYIP
jgi:hypothetical protein